MIQRLALLAVSTLIGLVLVGCDGASGSTVNTCDYDYKRLMESGWVYYNQIPLDDAGQPLCVLLYQVDTPRPNSERQNYPVETPKIMPVHGIVYRRDRDRLRDIHAYSLKLPQDMSLGEHAGGSNDRVTPSLQDVLSDLPGPELVITDKDAYEVVLQASIFQWRGEDANSEKNSYQSQGWFVGNAGIKLEQNQVTTLDRMWGTRSQLAIRKVYRPHGNKTYYKKDSTDIVDPSSVDVISLDMPAEQNLVMAQYPEKLVLAFYASLPMVYSETVKLRDWMSADAYAAYLKRDKAFACLTDPQLSQMFVQEIDIKGSPGIPDHIYQVDYDRTDKIVILALCRFRSEFKRADQSNKLEWPVQWKWKGDTRIGNWQLQKPVVNP